MAVGLASWTVCAWAQADAAHSAADSYREQLKAEASDAQQSTSPDSSSREAYKDHLRRLSGDESASGMRAAESEKPADDGKSNAGSEAVSPDSAAQTANSQPE